MNLDGKSMIVGAIGAAIVAWGIGQAKPPAKPPLATTQQQRMEHFSSAGHYYGRAVMHAYRCVTDGAGGILLIDDTDPGIILHYQKLQDGYYYDFIEAKPLNN